MLPRDTLNKAILGKGALFCQILQGAVSNYQMLISSELFLAKVTAICTNDKKSKEIAICTKAFQQKARSPFKMSETTLLASIWRILQN